MKNFLKYHVLSALTATICALVLSYFFLEILPSKANQTKTISGTVELKSKELSNLAASEKDELELLASLMDKSGVSLFGSSELAGLQITKPSIWLEKNTSLRVCSYGHAFQQCFAIYCQLLANQEQLKDAQICIILSPTWFETDGTNAQAILEFVRPNFFNQIASNPKISRKDKDYVGEVLNINAKDFSGSSSAMDFLMNSNRIHHSRYLPNALLKVYPLKKVVYSVTIKNSENNNKTSLIPIDWKALQSYCQDTFAKKIKSNSFFISDYYYQNILLEGGKAYRKGNFVPKELSENQEWKDLQMLLQLLYEQGAKTSIVIQGINPFHYQGVEKFDPIRKKIQMLCQKYQMPCLNLFQSDPKKFEVGSLNDIMHMGDYGWMRMNEFIYKNHSKK